MHRALLDTDILSAIMKQHPMVLPKAKKYLQEYRQFTLSLITRYEILRGLTAKKAIKQVQAFNLFCSRNEILSLTDEIVLKAAEIYGDLKNQGALIGDADVLIAATALVNGLCVVTNNESHFQRIQELSVENWLK